jgi:hypothetical protein
LKTASEGDLKPPGSNNMEEVLISVALIIIIYAFLGIAYKKGW